MWWLHNLSSSNGLSFLSKDPDLLIYSDASLYGWGFSYDGIQSRGPWTLDDRFRHINELELLAAFYALKSLTAHSSDLSVHMVLDNSTAVCYINNRGGTKSKSLCALAKSIVAWCEEKRLSISATHLPGVIISIADDQSRRSLDASDWMLNKAAFHDIQTLWPTEIDLFSAAWNAQHQKFVSWTLQPDAFALNAFALNWSR